MQISAPECIGILFVGAVTLVVVGFLAGSKSRPDSESFGGVGDSSRSWRPQRNLEDYVDNYEPDLSHLSLYFEACIAVESVGYMDELSMATAAEEDKNYTFTALNRLVGYSLCRPLSGDNVDADVHPCDTSDYYDSYAVAMEDYLEATIGQLYDSFEAMCQRCDDKCGYNRQEDDGTQNDDDDDDYAEYNDLQMLDDDGWTNTTGIDLTDENPGQRRLQTKRSNRDRVRCDTCVDECLRVENMEENGYIDAAEFLECQMIFDPEDDSLGSLYAGPICAGAGMEIAIGVFSDEDCKVLEPEKHVEDYLIDSDGYALKLSYFFLKQTYGRDSSFSCKEPGKRKKSWDDAEDIDKVLGMCEELHELGVRNMPGLEAVFSQYRGR